MSKHNIGKKLKGTGVALVTPFTKNLKIDFDGLRNLINYTSTGGVDYFVVLGTTGESPTLSKEEKKDILEFVKKNNKKKLPIVYGMGGNNTEEIMHFAGCWEDMQEEEFDSFSEDIFNRRKTAFSRRREFETLTD